jgi:uncharacterized protein YceK
MKRILILAIALLLLAGCGTAIEQPTEAPTSVAATTEVTATEENTTTQASISADRKPFTKEDVAAMQQGFKNVGDYVKAVPAGRYKYWVLEDFAYVYFYKNAQISEEGEDAFLCLKTDDAILGYSELGTESFETLPDKLLSPPVRIEFFRFPAAGISITPPRGIKIGDPAQKIFDSYPDLRVPGQEDILYDIALLYPEAGAIESDEFIGGRAVMSSHGDGFGSVTFRYAELLTESHELAQPLRLNYRIENDIVTAINFNRYFEEP